MAFENEDRTATAGAALLMRDRRLNLLVALGTLASLSVGFMAWAGAPPLAQVLVTGAAFTFGVMGAVICQRAIRA